MTVGELIEKLQSFPPETKVVFSDYEGLSSPGFDIDAAELQGPDPEVLEVPEWIKGLEEAKQAEYLRDEEKMRIDEGRDKPWVMLS